jgi:hypothetical protein
MPEVNEELINWMQRICTSSDAYVTFRFPQATDRTTRGVRESTEQLFKAMLVAYDVDQPIDRRKEAIYTIAFSVTGGAVELDESYDFIFQQLQGLVSQQPELLSSVLEVWERILAKDGLSLKVYRDAVWGVNFVCEQESSLIRPSTINVLHLRMGIDSLRDKVVETLQLIAQKRSDLKNDALAGLPSGESAASPVESKKPIVEEDDLLRANSVLDTTLGQFDRSEAREIVRRIPITEKVRSGDEAIVFGVVFQRVNSSDQFLSPKVVIRFKRDGNIDVMYSHWGSLPDGAPEPASALGERKVGDNIEWKYGYQTTEFSMVYFAKSGDLVLRLPRIIKEAPPVPLSYQAWTIDVAQVASSPAAKKVDNEDSDQVLNDFAGDLLQAIGEGTLGAKDNHSRLSAALSEFAAAKEDLKKEDARRESPFIRYEPRSYPDENERYRLKLQRVTKARENLRDFLRKILPSLPDNILSNISNNFPLLLTSWLLSNPDIYYAPENLARDILKRLQVGEVNHSSLAAALSEFAAAKQILDEEDARMESPFVRYEADPDYGIRRGIKSKRVDKARESLRGLLRKILPSLQGKDLGDIVRSSSQGAASLVEREVNLPANFPQPDTARGDRMLANFERTTGVEQIEGVIPIPEEVISGKKAIVICSTIRGGGIIVPYTWIMLKKDGNIDIIHDYWGSASPEQLSRGSTLNQLRYVWLEGEGLVEAKWSYGPGGIEPEFIIAYSASDKKSLTFSLLPIDKAPKRAPIFYQAWTVDIPQGASSPVDEKKPVNLLVDKAELEKYVEGARNPLLPEPSRIEALMVLRAARAIDDLRAIVQDSSLDDWGREHALRVYIDVARAVDAALIPDLRAIVQDSSRSYDFRTAASDALMMAGSSSPIDQPGATVSSPAEKQQDSPKNLAGIDFRTMNIIAQPMGNFSGLSFKLPKLANVEKINLDEEFKQIQLMVERGMVPSAERLKEFVAAAFQKQELDKRVDGLLACLVDICRLEEELVAESSPGLKEVLVIVDTNKFVL